MHMHVVAETYFTLKIYSLKYKITDIEFRTNVLKLSIKMQL